MLETVLLTSIKYDRLMKLKIEFVWTVLLWFMQSSITFGLYGVQLNPRKINSLKLTVAQLVKNSQPFIEHEILSPCLQISSIECSLLNTHITLEIF